MTMYRLATKADLKKILWIFNDVILNTTAIYQEALMTESDIEVWYEKKLKNNYPVFVAECENEVIGFTSYGPFREKEGYRNTVELAIHIAPQFRGRGVGKKLLSMLIEKAKENEIHTMIAAIDSANKQSIHLHEKFDFTVVGDLKQVAKKFNQWLDLTFMQLMLKDRKVISS